MSASRAVREPRVSRGTGSVFFAYDIAAYIELDVCQRALAAASQRQSIRQKRRALEYFGYRPAPLRISMDGETVSLGSFTTTGGVGIDIYDFGAVGMTYSIPIGGPVEDLVQLSADIFDSVELRELALSQLQEVSSGLVEAMEGHKIAEIVEDYVFFHVESFEEPLTPDELLGQHAQSVARLPRAEESTLSDQEVADALSARISFSRSDVSVIDWNAALIVGQDVNDVYTVIEFANIQLLEMRFLDRQLDSALEQSYSLVSHRKGDWLFSLRSHRGDLHRIAQFQVDGAMLFERVTNALKVFGEEYLSRIYRLIAGRLQLGAWDQTIIRKLATLDSIYGKLSDQTAARRMELLEWIIVVLIALSILLSLH